MALRRENTQRASESCRGKIFFFVDDDPTSSQSWMSQWIENFTKKMSSLQSRKRRKSLLELLEHGLAKWGGDQILKILLCCILLFNKRVVQPTSMAYVKCVYEKGQIMWIMISSSLLRSLSEKFTNYKWNFHVSSSNRSSSRRSIQAWNLHGTFNG